MSYLEMPAGARVSGVASNDPARPALTCAHLERHGDNWWLYASDSYQLVKLQLVEVKDKWDEPLREKGAIPRDALTVIEKAGAFRPERDGIRPIKKGQPLSMRFDWQDDLGKVPAFEEILAPLVAGTPEMRIGINPDFLLSASRGLGIKDGCVELVIRDPLKGIELRGGKNAASVALVMPIRIFEPYTLVANATSELLTVIGDASKRADVVDAYRAALDLGVDWEQVNTAIIERWSVSALKWIKQQAWKGAPAELVAKRKESAKAKEVAGADA